MCLFVQPSPGLQSPVPPFIVHSYLECDIDALPCPRVEEYSRTNEESASRKAWNSLREKALVIVNLHNLVHDESDIDSNYVRINTSLYKLIKERDVLCRERLVTAFLLENPYSMQNISWSCAWTGVDQRPQCVIVPPEYNTQPYHLVEPKIVREKLFKFRTALRCEQTWIDQVNNASEIYICNDRCTQVGVGYATCLLILATFGLLLAHRCNR